MSRINHIGIIVDDLDKTISVLEGAFGLTVESRFDVPGRPNTVAFVRWGDISLELVQTGDAGIRAERLAGRPAMIDHIALEADDLDRFVADVRAKGVDTVETEPLEMLGHRMFHFKPQDTLGVRLECLETRK